MYDQRWSYFAPRNQVTRNLQLNPIFCKAKRVVHSPQNAISEDHEFKIQIRTAR